MPLLPTIALAVTLNAETAVIAAKLAAAILPRFFFFILKISFAN